MQTDSSPATDSTRMSSRVVSRDEWLRERLALLAEEKELTRRRDAVASRVRSMPWVRVDKQYIFDATPDWGSRLSLADLFGARSQLIVYHFMFDPTWSQGCKSCSFVADHYNGIVVHLAQRDISFITVSKAPIDMIEAFRVRMGWSFPWVSEASSGFGRDFGVSFTDSELADPTSLYNYTARPYPIRELPGVSVFTKDSCGTIFHTYSTFARGLEEFLAAYRYIDITPKGRDEAEGAGMGWLRHHDRYDGSAFVDPWAERPGITSPSH
ncbi:MAG: DUF899 domain-containing protein [Phycisphaeraceae bacterium]|nr:DUF899 domain-containing protein [Phycisphaeraceae bacterium]